jgi:hypothetical protein
MAVFKKQGVYWIDYYVGGHRKRERIGPDKKLAEVVLKKRKVEIAEGKYLDKRTVPRCSFSELADLYLNWAKVNHQGYVGTRSRVGLFRREFGTRQLSAITPLVVDEYVSRRAGVRKPATVNRDLVVLRHMFRKARGSGEKLPIIQSATRSRYGPTIGACATCLRRKSTVCCQRLMSAYVRSWSSLSIPGSGVANSSR